MLPVSVVELKKLLFGGWVPVCSGAKALVPKAIAAGLLEGGVIDIEVSVAAMELLLNIPKVANVGAVDDASAGARTAGGIELALGVTRLAGDSKRGKGLTS